MSAVIPAGFGAIRDDADKMLGKTTRFRSDGANTHMARNFKVPSCIFTFSFWVKRGKLNANQCVFGWTNNSDTSFGIVLNDKNQLDYFDYYKAYRQRVLTAHKFTDTSAFYHVVISNNPTLTADIIKIFVNGNRVTNYDPASVLPIKQDNNMKDDHSWVIGSLSGIYKFDGSLSEFHFVSDAEVDVSEFGKLNADGVWVPKKYTGIYGLTGFYLPMGSIDVGIDKSGNGNDFVGHDFDAAFDIMSDSPNENMPVLQGFFQPSGTYELRDANLIGFANNTYLISSVNIPDTGLWYFEAFILATVGPMKIGICNRSPDITNKILYQNDGKKFTGSTASTYGAAYGDHQNIGVAVDCVAKRIEFFLDGVSQGKINFGESSLSVSDIAVIVSGSGPGASWQMNFGQLPFKHTPPTGFKAFTTAKIPASTSIKTSGAFTGNANADGPYVWLGGNPETLTINGNAVVWGTHANRLAGGFKVITAAATHNAAGNNTYAVTSTGKKFGDIAHAPNVAQLNP